MNNACMNRRSFLKTAGIAATALIPVVLLDSKAAIAQDLPLIEESNPSAIALGYKHDAAAVDVAKFPKRATEEGKKEFCHNCALYTGVAGAATGPCAIFPGKSVNANGWCSVWAPRPA